MAEGHHGQPGPFKQPLNLKNLAPSNDPSHHHLELREASRGPVSKAPQVHCLVPASSVQKAPNREKANDL